MVIEGTLDGNLEGCGLSATTLLDGHIYFSVFGTCIAINPMERLLEGLMNTRQTGSWIRARSRLTPVQI